MKGNYEFSSIEVFVKRKNKKIVTIIVILIITFFIYLGIKQLISENIAIGKDDIDKNEIEIEISKVEEKPKVITEEIKNKINGIYKSEEKRAFLTFDDGPSNITGSILDILKEKNIKATFFVLGSNVDKNPELVKRMYDEGHFIANHGYTHIYEKIYRSKETVLEEYDRCNDSISRAIGIQGYNPHLFRFPGGYLGESTYTQIKQEAGKFLEDNDIMNVDWNALTGDSEGTGMNLKGIMGNIQNTTKDKNSVVVLMHDASGKQITCETLPNVIEYLTNSGYVFKSFYDVF